MKAEINNENRRRFEALYFGQDVFWSCREPMEKDKIIDGRKLARPFSKYDAIELKPLSKISDEDVIEVAKIFRWNHYSDESKVFQVKTFLSQYLDYHNTNISPNEYFQLCDYLRSKGYALPWMGLSVEEMVEAGWIKLIEE